MYYKQQKNNNGKYQKIDTKEKYNLIGGAVVYFPAGLDKQAAGWNEFETLEAALDYYNLEVVV